MADLNQALPTQYSGLGDLWDRAPILAAMQTGDQMRWAQQNNQSLQDAFANQEAYKQQQRPLELDKLRADTGLTNAHTGYFGAETGKINQATDELKQTQPGRIQKTNAENQAGLGAAQIEEMQQMGQRMRLAAAAAASEPTPWGKVQKVKAILGNSVQQTPEFDEFLMKHANNLHTYLADYGQNMFEASDRYKTEKMKEDAALARTQEQTRSAEAIAKANIDAGRWNRPGRTILTLEQNIDKEGDPVKKYTMLVEAAQAAMNSGDTDHAERFAARATAIKGIAEQSMAAKGGGAAVVTQPVGGKPQLTPRSGAGTKLPTPPGVKQDPMSILPQGTKDNGDGTYTLPSGKRVRPKQ